MKKPIILFISLFIPLLICGQDIENAEFFIDSDPGYGMATPIAVSAAGSDIALDFTADLNGLQQGIHYMVIRARDDLGVWSQGTNTVFYLIHTDVISESNIDQAEFFIDSDPGYGMATPIAVSAAGSDIALDFTADLTGLQQGIHYMVIRAQDDLGVWSQGTNTVFYLIHTDVVSESNIDQAEYFIDSDPGYGMATPIAVSAAGSDIVLDFTEDMAGLQQGIHYLVIRARDDQGVWSQGTNTVFYLLRTDDIGESDIAHAEYFIDTDPGFGLGISIPVPAPGNDLTLQLSPGLESLDQGLHYIHFRAKDVSGRWGSVMNAVFLVVALPSSAESEIQQVEYFIDTDPGFGLGTPVTLPSGGSDLTIDFSVSLTGLADGDHVLYIRAGNALNHWGQLYAEGFSYTSTGIGEAVNSLYKVYPNPSSGRLQIELSDQVPTGFSIKLIDLNGKLVYDGECHSNLCELNLELPGGMYLLKIESSERSISQKIILE